DTLAGYTCTCKPGFYGDGFNCNSFNECIEGTDECDQNAVCYDRQEGYDCIFNDGFIPVDGIVASGPVEGEDIEECLTQADDCPINTVCTNTIGSFTCDAIGARRRRRSIE
ncbi:unnamed protein product, partial [Owenia fusiformis]